VRTGTRAFLSAIKEINVTAATDKRTLRHLESDIRLLAEILEPLGYTESHLFSPELLHQLRRLGRKLQDISRTMKRSISSGENRRQFFSSQPESTGGDLNSFVEDFHLAMDEFRVTALPMYSVSTMEAAVRPLGIVSNSSCALLPFLDWVLQSRRVMDHRFGLIRTVRMCYRGYRVSGSRRRVRGSDLSAEAPLREYGLLHVGLLNARGIENWLEIETTATSTRGIVTFSPTNEALVCGAVAYSYHPILVGDPGQSMTDLARWIEDGIQLALTADRPFDAYNVYAMFIPYSRHGVDPPGNRLYDHPDKLKLFLPASLLTDEEVRHEL